MPCQLMFNTVISSYLWLEVIMVWTLSSANCSTQEEVSCTRGPFLSIMNAIDCGATMTEILYEISTV